METIIKLAPSILSADFANLERDIHAIEQGGADYVHIDVMDGSFVPSISFGMPVIKSIRKCTELFFDVHLMIEEPGRYISDFKAAGADLLTVHAEACTHLHRTVMAVKDAGMKVGVALNPATPLSALDYIIKEVDMVLIMSVNPGFGGQSFIEETYEKVNKTHEMIQSIGKQIDIQVDGGIKTDNASKVLKSGANVLVAGTSVFAGDVAKNMLAFKEVFNFVSRGNSSR